MRVSRRALFFAALCTVCLVLIPVTPEAFRWVNLSMAGLALFWAIVIGIEDLATARRGRRREQGA
jgi:hypothetical protein